MIKKFNILLFSLFFISTYSYAGAWIEPLIGYKASYGEVTFSNYGSASGDYKFTHTGPQYGLKLGYEFPIAFVAGIDYRMSSGARKQRLGPTTIFNTVDVDQTSLAGFITFTTLPLLNFWAHYFFNVETEETSGNSIGSKASGNGIGFGAGFTGLPFVSLNVEYNMLTFNETVLNGVTLSLPTNIQSEIDVYELVFSVSLPIDFLF